MNLLLQSSFSNNKAVIIKKYWESVGAPEQGLWLHWVPFHVSHGINASTQTTFGHRQTSKFLFLAFPSISTYNTSGNSFCFHNHIYQKYFSHWMFSQQLNFFYLKKKTLKKTYVSILRNKKSGFSHPLFLTQLLRGGWKKNRWLFCHFLRLMNQIENPLQHSKTESLFVFCQMLRMI